ncbi:MAG: PEGA domain-containing protein [Myxococcales bacterium]|nr:PEGA domain-containing protein [Myxococcales bacterium]
MKPGLLARSRVALVTQLVLLAVAISTVPSAAAESKKPATPWSRGVSDAAQKRALKLFGAGNVFFEQAKYTEAVAKYEQALGAWDHPNIRFNIAICLINMRQPLVAWDHLEQALRFGAAPLGRRLHTEAITYRAALESSLAELTVRSTQPGVSVMIDGGKVLTGTKAHTIKLLAGKHQLVATRRGYVTDSRALDLPAGQPVTEEITLVPEVVKIERENYERRWRWWAPWAVVGGSLTFGLTGGIVYLSARSEIKQYDRDLAQMCPLGCVDADIPSSLKDHETSARRKSGVAIGLWTGAGALVIAGGVMAILNRPRKIEDNRVVPAVTVSPGYIGAGVTFVLD